jgi:ABC-type uncharacterized transport system permease subunit
MHTFMHAYIHSFIHLYFQINRLTNQLISGLSIHTFIQAANHLIYQCLINHSKDMFNIRPNYFSMYFIRQWTILMLHY